MRVPTRKQLSNLRERKDPLKKARSTKVHDDKHAYKRNAPVVCEECDHIAEACVCAETLRDDFDIGE